MFHIPLKKIIFLLIILFSASKFSTAQMPDWTLVKDKEGNRLYFDQNGRIWTSGEPEFMYKPVSIECIDYYINQGIELLRGHYIIEGLTLLKSILAMPVYNNRIFDAQKKAKKEVQYLTKKHGQRFVKYSTEASILLYKENQIVALINDYMAYLINVPPELKIIKKKTREANNYFYYGISIGLNLKKNAIVKKNGYYRYDLIIAIDCEKFSKRLESINRVLEISKNRLGHDTFIRKLVDKHNDKILYSYRDSKAPHYSGFDGYFLKDDKSYHLRSICSEELFLQNSKKIEKIIKSFKI